ncbi:MAG: translation initiation factor IF-3 [bacterium]
MRVNEGIRAKHVKLINEQGKLAGIVETREALLVARSKQLDLVEIVPGQTPPICKIINYSKYRYEQEKKDKQARKHRRIGQLKEVRMRSTIGEHDLDVKSRHIQEFLETGRKVKVTVNFRGRETSHADLGRKVLETIKENFSSIASCEQEPRLEGHRMTMLLVPKKKGAA